MVHLANGDDVGHYFFVKPTIMMIMRMMMMKRMMMMMMMNMKVAAAFDTMTIGLQSAIMSEGQFTLTDDTRTAPTSSTSTSLSCLLQHSYLLQAAATPICTLQSKSLTKFCSIKGAKALGGVVSPIRPACLPFEQTSQARDVP